MRRRCAWAASGESPSVKRPTGKRPEWSSSTRIASTSWTGAMCYLIHVSTSSTEDFSQLPTDLYRFEHANQQCDEEPLKLLKHSNKWFLSCRYGGCSCHYRHLECVGRDPESGPPEDWFPEDDDDIESTAAVYDVFARVIAEG